MGDIVEQRVTPNTPRVIDNQEVKVYVPVASSSQKGVAKYNPTDFFIDSKGSVNLRHPISQQRAFANPLVDPEAMANIGQPGHENDNSVSLIKLLDIEFKHLQEGEYGYDPRSILGVLKLNREQLSQESLEKPSLVMLNSLDFLQIVTAEGYTKSNIRWPLYPIDDTTKDIVEDTTRKLSFVMSHVYFDIDANKLLTLNLPIASEPSEVLDAEKGFGMVRINNTATSENSWLRFVPRASDGLKDLTFNEGLLGEYVSSKLNKLVPNYPNSTYIDEYVISDPDDPTGMRKLAYLANFVKEGLTVVSKVDGKQYSNGAQLPYGEPFDEDTMVQRTLLLLTKEGIGLDKIPNLDPKEWEVSNPVRTLLNIIQSGTSSSQVMPFSKKKDASEYDEDIGIEYEQSDNPTTVKQRIANLEAKVGDLTNISYGFIGYVTVAEGEDITNYLNTNYPVTTPGFGDLTHIFVTNTNTLWGWTSTTWVDTNVNVIKGDEFQYKLNGVTKTFKITSADTQAGQEDFVTAFNNTLLQLQLNVPYVREGQYVHNWRGQLPNGVEEFTKGTSTNGLFKKLWFGTSEEYQNEFPSNPDDSVIAFINDDSIQYDGTLVDEGKLENRLDGFTVDLLDGAEATKTYVIAPITVTSGLAPNSKGWKLEEINLSEFLTLHIPKEGDVTNIIGSGDENTGILRYNAMDFALMSPNANATDPIMGIPYKTIRKTESGLLNPTALGREVTRGGAYLTITDLQTSFGNNTNNKHLFKHLIDTEYQVTNYPNWESGKPGASVSSFIQSSINKVWDAILTIDTKLTTQSNNYSGIVNKLNKYPDPNLAKGNAGNYLMSIADADGNLQMTMLNIESIVGKNPLSEEVNINSWVHGTGNNIVQAIPMTGQNFANSFAEASKVKYYNAKTDSNNNLKFWIGEKADYDLLTAGNAVDNSTLYLCLDGWIYFGVRLIGKTTITSVDINNIVTNMTTTQVQTLLNKLGTI